MDSQELELEQIKNENQVLKLKLKSKSEALHILSQELQKIRTNKNLNESLDLLETLPNSTLLSQLHDTKQQLREAHDDIKLLRDKMARDQVDGGGEVTDQFSADERRNLIRMLEDSNNKLEQSLKDLRHVSDERDEVVCEKEVFESKFIALNKRLNELLGNSQRPVDINAVLTDNEYLKERIKTVEDEKKMTNSALSKYKEAMEKKKVKGILKLGQQRSSVMVVPQKQVQSLLSSIDPTSSKYHNAQTLTDLHSLASNLLESLNDKSTALSHLRKTNRLLGSRIEELERKLKLWDEKDQRRMSEPAKQLPQPTQPPFDLLQLQNQLFDDLNSNIYENSIPIQPIRTNHTPVSTNHTPVSTNHTPVSINHTSVSTNHTSVSTNHTPVSTNQTESSFTNRSPISSTFPQSHNIFS